MTRAGLASILASVLIAFLGALASAVLSPAAVATWALLAIVGLAAGAVAGRPALVWLALGGCVAADACVAFASGDAGGPFWPLLWASRLVIVFVTFVPGTALGFPPRGLPRRWRVAAATTVAVSLVGLLGYVGYAFANSGQYLTQAGEGDCRTPAVAPYGWDYQAINYDQADDARLMAAHPDATRCFIGNVEQNGPDQGQKAGTEVVSSDGIHVAGWYIPAADGSPPTGPTLVLVHGGKGNKSGMLKYAVPFHASYNLVLLDLRNQGRSTGDVSSGGVLEARDLRAMIDWLERTKHPSWLGLVGNSNGAATALVEVADDQRPRALVLDSMHASVVTQLGTILETERKPPLPAWPSAWAVITGASWQLGADITAADPERTIALVGDRPVLLLHGLRDATNPPPLSLQRNVAAALASGVNVEVHVCPSGGHGTVIDMCPDAWATWATHFLAVARGVPG